MINQIKIKENKSNIDVIIELEALSLKSNIKNSEIILSIIEICSFKKKYNYTCSNNTKSAWERVIKNNILKKNFKNYKSETLRKYWAIIRQTKNNNKFIEIVRQNENFINNQAFKLLQLINRISVYIISPPDENKTFQEFFESNALIISYYHILKFNLHYFSNLILIKYKIYFIFINKL